MSYNLSFISDDDLYDHVKNTIHKYRFKIDFKTLNKNLIDPIKLRFDSAIYHGNYSNESLEKVLNDEVHRQIDKSNTNHIGYFHQNIFQFIGGDDWVVPEKGFDVENLKKKIYIEMKNKHNTMNSSSSAKTYMRMQNKILHDPQSTCMLVEAIAKTSQNVEWACTIDKQKVSHKSIRRVSLDKFYEIVTGEKDAFANLCKILPLVIRQVLKNETKQIIENSVMDDIRKNNVENILNNLYLLTFKKYQGFNEFELSTE
ncbi:Eco47II family restriction endonuclease [Haemophilus influenzae]|uniref:Eco47II restriction endonuclease n=1 Tax=Haemophilus influenzae TaxID=727 RepID=A0AB37B8G4_HAEIF|nr:Eco47II family restriction endonuclease [Haemophilus influenzae]PRJ25795.1 Eco47II restriction endonuclease [Haemophilus influenzae]PRJ71759.1 Eco47II restriction endonuclease [Haemophilus influenzae]PRM82667.1 Eco47II restriction endonuclease [Haemophilus influenzae]